MNTHMKSCRKKMICPYDCPSSCGVTAVIESGRVTKTEGDPCHPVSHGMLCGKMRSYADEINSPSRILTPLKRSGPKGSGQFSPVSWEEAGRIITERWKEIICENGSEAIGYCYYSGVMSVIQRHCIQALFSRMGASELVKTLCSSAKGSGYASVVGNTGCLDPRELKDSSLYLIWGSNVVSTRLPVLKDLTEARRAGKKVILIEVYGTPMAPYCDETILIRPGTDGALALALMHELDRNHWSDEEFLNFYGIGYPQFRETLSSYSPEWASEITGIPAETIRSLAARYASAAAPAILLGSGLSRYGNGAMTVRLITILSLFTGAWKKPGGGLCGCTPYGISYFDGTVVKRPDLRRNSPKHTININQLSHALSKTGDSVLLRSLYVAGSNPACSVSDQLGVKKGLMREDLFTVVHERFLTDTAKYADIILPATFSAEQSDCYEAYGYCTMAAAPKLVEPAGEAKSNWDTITLLAKGMGYDDPYFQNSETDMVRQLICTPTKTSSFLSEKDRRKLLDGCTISMPFSNHTDFQTPDKKFYIINERLSEPIPHYTESYGGPESLRLISVPSRFTLNSIFYSHPGQIKKRGPMSLIMHKEDALRRGIENGDSVICFNDLAQVTFTASLTDQIAKGTVAAVGVYSMEQSTSGLTCNALHHARLSDEGAATTMNDNTVEVRKA